MLGARPGYKNGEYHSGSPRYEIIIEIIGSKWQLYAWASTILWSWL